MLIQIIVSATTDISKMVLMCRVLLVDMTVKHVIRDLPVSPVIRLLIVFWIRFLFLAYARINTSKMPKKIVNPVFILVKIVSFS